MQPSSPSNTVVDIKTGGVKPGELMIMMAGRQHGKSQMAAYSRLWQDIMQADTKVTDILLSEGTVFGARYYTVEPIGGSWLEMETWCSEVFGSASSVWEGTFTTTDAGRWYANNRKFWFRREKDRTMFILKWSGQ